MFSNSKLSGYKVRKIIWCFCVNINASKIAVLLGHNRNTINYWFNVFRQVIYNEQEALKEKLVGKIEIDESYFGATRPRGFHGKLKRGRGTLKQPVFGVFERDGRVCTEIIPDCKKATLQAVIKRKAPLESLIYSDGCRGYPKHFRVNHGANEFARDGHCHTNGIESFWSFTKRRLAKLNGVKVNFELHLKECEWRWKKDTDVLAKELSNMLKINSSASLEPLLI